MSAILFAFRNLRSEGNIFYSKIYRTFVLYLLLVELIGCLRILRYGGMPCFDFDHVNIEKRSVSRIVLLFLEEFDNTDSRLAVS